MVLWLLGLKAIDEDVAIVDLSIDDDVGGLRCYSILLNDYGPKGLVPLKPGTAPP